MIYKGRSVNIFVSCNLAMLHSTNSKAIGFVAINLIETCINPSHIIKLQYQSMYIQYTLKIYACILNCPSVMMLCSFRPTSFTFSLDRICFQFQASPRIPCGRVGPISMSPSSVAKRSTVADLDHACVTEGNQQFVTDTCHAGCEAKTKLCETSIVSLGKKTNSKGYKLPAFEGQDEPCKSWGKGKTSLGVCFTCNPAKSAS